MGSRWYYSHKRSLSVYLCLSVSVSVSFYLSVSFSPSSPPLSICVCVCVRSPIFIERLLYTVHSTVPVRRSEESVPRSTVSIKNHLLIIRTVPPTSTPTPQTTDTAPLQQYSSVQTKQTCEENKKRRARGQWVRHQCR